ncbi:fungal-specific transcription factor domain-containing protein [Aspergillus pseudoustus]|uniref:Fungal-specific transcription factor domain-containing protein n=1 Tax=Aspergillus pseudoustus TaxID=1810923 RepID=A0ABR4IYN7_9EURO
METTTRSAQASQVCKSCKDRKRRCDKALPKCSLSVPADQSSPAAPESYCEDGMGIPHQSSSDRAAVQPITLSTVQFLDPTLLQHGPLELHRPNIEIRSVLLEVLGGIDKIRATADRFFTNIHPWMPFISKQRFYSQHLSAEPHFGAELIILSVAVRLITMYSPENPRHGLYPLAKYHYFRIEGSTAPSILILQANILIALYELGHGIYPAAYLTIGACARYMYALGINGTRSRSADMNMPRPVSLVEVEERKRVWWAVVILDRFVSIASPSRPFATPDPELNDLMPANDEDWDNGFVNGADMHTISTPTPGHMCKFSLLCQAARVLGKVLCFLNRFGGRNGHIPESEKMPLSLENHERMQLDSTLQSMLNAAMELDVPDLDTITFIYSAMMALYTPHLPTTYSTHRSSTPPTYDDPTTRSLEIVDQITEAIASSLLDKRCISGRNPEGMSPWRAYFGYRVLGVHMATMRAARSRGEDTVSIHVHTMRGEGAGREVDVEQVISVMRRALQVIGSRWKLGDIYLRLLEAQEVLDAGV